MQPLVDTAGAGISYLDTVVLQTAQGGLLSKNCSRILYVAKLVRGASAISLATLHKTYFGEMEADATGLIVLQPNSMWALLECSPEAVAGLFRKLEIEINRTKPGGGGELLLLSDATVVAVIEDCPHRILDQLHCTAAAPQAESVPDLEVENPASVSTTLLKTVTSIAQAIMSTGGTLNGGTPEAAARIGEVCGSALPSDERCQSIATLSKLLSVSEWLKAFDLAPSFDSASEQVYPLPTRTVY